MDYVDIIDTLEDLKYLDWGFVVKVDNGRMYLHVEFETEDLVSTDITLQRGRKWVISEHMTKSELVQTAWLAVITAVEHEARESFRYKGHRIFGPHFDVEKLAELAKSKDNLDIRTRVG